MPRPPVHRRISRASRCTAPIGRARAHRRQIVRMTRAKQSREWWQLFACQCEFFPKRCDRQRRHAIAAAANDTVDDGDRLLGIAPAQIPARTIGLVARAQGAAGSKWRTLAQEPPTQEGIALTKTACDLDRRALRELAASSDLHRWRVRARPSVQVKAVRPRERRAGLGSGSRSRRHDRS